MADPAVVRELILGGQRSGKSRRAELLAQQWLAGSPARRAVMVATAQPWDAEMRARIAQHQQDRAERLPAMETLEEPLHLPEAILGLSTPETLVVVDCLTLWLSNLMMPPDLDPARAAAPETGALLALLPELLAETTGPVVLVSNEIGLGVVPMGEEVRLYVDLLGRLNQQVAAVCERVTFMAAGLPMTLKGGA
ncbi:bifunctional adenosylcobinamide kinase/adenosylcobinamide-phosphate guanylyltransferase [Xenophilus arseniciresistens]|uniref:Bifunctional adenosylcobalamin biosynthesis protein n=1 Tax=Xenophilus arseniciresistens TaxID=1283306 RepID=A0AAE3N686_9BURK|nr:bifunctional adenosylcobinamide kinase/adenosylcobinamide-phosphate guanylyltransferase [Xenophilus arseniciresistens]MDA7415638.1 bifunctional adenosylcobinamide kinase/adenosylcobinamide-phosphate guanylyltransferase [Xenophilus arseniciresistens]